MSNLLSGAISASCATEAAATRKATKYTALSQCYIFMPVALKSQVYESKTSADFISQLGRRIIAVTSEWKESSFLFQRLSVAIQLSTLFAFMTLLLGKMLVQK